MKIDTGAKVNVMSKLRLSCLGGVVDQSQTAKLVGFGGHCTSTIGIARLSCLFGGKERSLVFHVVDKDVRTLLCLKDSLHLGLITLSEDVHTVGLSNQEELPGIMKNYPELFNGKLGRLPIKPHKIQVDPVPPVVRPVRNVPVGL